MAKRPVRPTTVGDIENSFSPASAPSKASRLSLEKGGGDPEHRGFPRAALSTRFQLSIGEGADRRFSAVLSSSNLSVSGAFLQSSFFLPTGTQMKVTFELEEGEEVSALAEVIREEREPKEGRGDKERGTGRVGMGIRFLEFFNQSEVSMAKLFVGERLRDFVSTYQGSKRAKSAPNELERAIDLLAAWELRRINTETDPWRTVGEKD
jgi:hypothetical protein